MLALATQNILTDTGLSPNLFLFTNLTLPSETAPVAPPPAAASASAGQKSRVSIGLVVGIAVPVALIAGARCSQSLLPQALSCYWS